MNRFDFSTKRKIPLIDYLNVVKYFRKVLYLQSYPTNKARESNG